MDRKWKDISTIESGTRWGKIKGRMMCVVGTICLGLKMLMFIRVTRVLRIWSQIWPLFQVLFGISSNSSYEYGSRASVLLMQEEINKKKKMDGFSEFLLISILEWFSFLLFSISIHMIHLQIIAWVASLAL